MDSLGLSHPALRARSHFSSFIFLQISLVCPVFESITVVTARQLQVTVLAFSCLITTQCSMSSAAGGGSWLRIGGGVVATGCFFAAQPARSRHNTNHALVMSLFSLSRACLSMAILITHTDADTVLRRAANYRLERGPSAEVGSGGAHFSKSARSGASRVRKSARRRFYLSCTRGRWSLHELLDRDQLLHQLRVVLLLQTVNLLVVFVHFAGVIHGAEFRAAHGAEGCGLVSLFGEGFVVRRAGGLGVEGEFELLFPIEFVAGIA